MRRTARYATPPSLRPSVADEDEVAVFQVVDDGLQDAGQQDGHALPLLLVVDREDGHAARRVIFPQRDDGGDAGSLRHLPAVLSGGAAPSGHRPEDAGLRTLPSRTGTYSIARTSARSSRSMGTMAMTTSPVCGFCRAMGRSSGSSTSVFRPKSSAASWAMAWR